MARVVLVVCGILCCLVAACLGATRAANTTVLVGVRLSEFRASAALFASAGSGGGGGGGGSGEGGELLKMWGNNEYGELGYGDKVDRGLKRSQMGDGLPFVDLGDDILLDDDGGTGDDVLASMGCGAGHCCAYGVTSLKCWGSNEAGQLGYGDKEWRGDNSGEMGNHLPVVSLQGSVITDVGLGLAHTCVVLDAVDVKCFGDNLLGELGYGDKEARGDQGNEMGAHLDAVDLGSAFQNGVASVCAGYGFTCALSADGDGKCWGDNSVGQLGQGDTHTRGDNEGEMGNALPAIDVGFNRSIEQLVCGVSHVCAVLDDDAASTVCWGSNLHGQLGRGDYETIGDEGGEMGSALIAVDVGDGDVVASISAGNAFTCAKLLSREVKCWGYNLYGQLGQGDRKDRGDAPGDMGDALEAIKVCGSGGRTACVEDVETGDFHACALVMNEGNGNGDDDHDDDDDHDEDDDDNDDIGELSLRCWGQNNEGQLGYGDNNNRGDGPGEMGGSLATVNLQGPTGFEDDIDDTASDNDDEDDGSHSLTEAATAGISIVTILFFLSIGFVLFRDHLPGDHSRQRPGLQPMEASSLQGSFDTQSLLGDDEMQQLDGFMPLDEI